MKKLILILASLLMTIIAYADPAGDGILGQILALQTYELPNLPLQLAKLAKEVKDLEGFTSLNIDNKDYATWGDDANSWQNVLNLASSGGSSSDLGQEMQDLSNDFPIDTTTYNKIATSKTQQKYYQLQATTTLATRAASRLDFNKLQQQIDYQHQLQDKIPMMQSVKQSIDLQNRMQSENNLIQLEMLRQAAINNQQSATNSQGDVNGTLANAKFLNK